MTKTVLFASAAVLALTGASYAGGAHQVTTGITGHYAKQHITHTPKGSVTLYDQTGNDSGAASTSQNFESSFDAYDSFGADDFTVPKHHKWVVKEVDVTGQYRYSGGFAATANVAFYADKNNLPGSVVASCPAADTHDSGQSGSFTLNCKAKLKKGHYWVSVQANLDFFGGPAEQWYWEISTSTPGSPAAWQNPGGGFGVGCTTWGTLASCLGTSGSWMFALKGKDKDKS